MSAAPGSTVIEARGLTRHFASFTAVDGIDLTIVAGQVFGLLGANGAGKTTAIRMLCGLLAPSAGEATVAGIDIVRQPRRARGHIGYVSQRFALYADLTVRENLNLQAGLYGLRGARRAQRVSWALSGMALEAEARTLAARLPLGYRQRLSLAAALLHEPGVLFLDEPTSGVDPVARQDFWELMYELAEEGIGILVTTHYMDEALFCDELALMHAGRVKARGTPAQLLARPLDTPILRLRAPDPGAWAQRLRQCEEVLEIVPHAGQLRLRLKPGTTVAAVRSRLEHMADGHGLALEGIEEVPPELEDVFVAVLEESGEVQAA